VTSSEYKNFKVNRIINLDKIIELKEKEKIVKNYKDFFRLMYFFPLDNLNIVQINAFSSSLR